MPFANADRKQQLPIVKLVDKIISIKYNDPNRAVTKLEAEIDAWAAHLYKLAEEEYSLILAETDASDPFRVAALNAYRDLT